MAAADATGAIALGQTRLRRHEWLSILGRAVRTRRGITGLVLSGSVILMAIIGPFVTPYSSTALQNAVDFTTPSSKYWLGTDYIGHDVLSRLLDGGWKLLVMALIGTVFGVLLGSAAGISAAYLRGRADTLIMRTVDVILAFPGLVFILMLVSIAGPTAWLITLAVGFGHAPSVARVMRSATLDVSERDFIKAVEQQGVKARTLMFREILPNLVSPLMVESGLRLTYSILAIAGISFLGFGLPPPQPSWGQMINENRIGISSNPWGVILPALVIAILTIGTNTFTDAVARVAIGVEKRDQGPGEEGHTIAREVVLLEADIGSHSPADVG